MAKYEIIIHEDDLPDLPKKYLEVCNILLKMRDFKKKWDLHYGSTNRNNLRRWEEAADEFIKKLKVKRQEDDGQIIPDE